LSGDDVLVVERVDEGIALLIAQFEGLVVGIIVDTRNEADLGAVSLVASTLEMGAPSGRQMRLLMSFLAAARATPCAWFPAEQAMTPAPSPPR